MADVYDVARVSGVTGPNGASLKDVLAVDATTTQDNGHGWPRVEPVELLTHNAWLVWQSLRSTVQNDPNVLPTTLGEALSVANHAIAVDFTQDVNAGGLLADVSMDRTISKLWTSLPESRAYYRNNMDPDAAYGYNARKTLARYLRVTANAVCVVRAGKNAYSTWWIRDEWSDQPPRQRVARPAVAPHPCPHPECAGRDPFRSPRGLAMHLGRSHKPDSVPAAPLAADPMWTSTPASMHAAPAALKAIEAATPATSVASEPPATRQLDRQSVAATVGWLLDDYERQCDRVIKLERENAKLREQLGQLKKLHATISRIHQD